jgi:microcompartment protein CcmL/EutN
MPEIATGTEYVAGEALGLLEIQALGAALVTLDAIDKAADIRLRQLELNDFYGIIIKVSGSVSSVRTAVQTGESILQRMGATGIFDVIPAPDERAWKALLSPPEFNPLLEAGVVKFPDYENLAPGSETSTTNRNSMEQFAIGLIETQGFTAVFEAIDTACKAANVTVIGKEKLGGGYVTVIIRGDVAAVNAAIEAGRTKVEGLGKLIAAHVIPRPSEAVLALLPKA